MKKLPITKEAFEKSKYFTNKYGKLEYVSESGKLFKTTKNKVLKFKESLGDYDDEKFFGDGTLHVFDYGEDYPFSESYLVILPSGEAFRSNGSDSPANGVSFWEDDNISYTTQDEMEDKFTEEHDGEEYRPNEIGLDSISRDLKKVIITFAKDSACETDYEDVMDFLESGKPFKTDNSIIRYGNRVDEAIPKTLKEIPKEQAEKLIQKHLRAGTGEWESSPGYSDFIYEIGGGRYKLIRPGYGGTYETGIVSMESTKRKAWKPLVKEAMSLGGVVSKRSPNDPGKTILTRNCFSCGKPHSIEVDTTELQEGLYAYQRGARMQDAFPNFTPDEREFFMSGICPKCWEEM